MRIAIFGQYKTGTTGLYSQILHSLPPDLAVRTLFEPSAFVPEPGDAEPLAPARDRPAADGRATAYVCRSFTCSAPVTEPSALDTLLREA